MKETITVYLSKDELDEAIRGYVRNKGYVIDLTSDIKVNPLGAQVKVLNVLKD